MRSNQNIVTSLFLSQGVFKFYQIIRTKIADFCRSDQSKILNISVPERTRLMSKKIPVQLSFHSRPKIILRFMVLQMMESWWPHFFIKLALIQVITERTFLNFDQKRSKQRFGGRLLPADSNSHFGNRKIFVK